MSSSCSGLLQSVDNNNIQLAPLQKNNKQIFIFKIFVSITHWNRYMIMGRTRLNNWPFINV